MVLTFLGITGIIVPVVISLLFLAGFEVYEFF